MQNNQSTTTAQQLLNDFNSLRTRFLTPAEPQNFMWVGKAILIRKEYIQKFLTASVQYTELFNKYSDLHQEYVCFTSSTEPYKSLYTCDLTAFVIP